MIYSLIIVLILSTQGQLLAIKAPNNNQNNFEQLNQKSNKSNIGTYNNLGEDKNQPTYINNIARADLVSFTNVTSEVGLSGLTGNFFAWGDYNNDDNQDLLINGGRLFRNNGYPTYTFTEVSKAAGITSSGNGAWADYDNDGYLDFYCCGSDILWHNEGPPEFKFRDVTKEAGNIRDDYPTTAVGWGDYDLDGYLDMYIANGEDWNDGNPIYYPDFLYHNNGNGSFTNVTATSGIRNFGGPYYGRGVSWGDYNDDGWPDIYISNYRISQNWLFHNNRNGTFTDVALEKGVAGEESQRMGTQYYGHTVGSAWADLDNDGDLDLFESDLAHKDLYRGPICGDSQLYRNDGKTQNYMFTDVREGSGITEKNIGGGEDELFVGIAIGDFDNDGFQDLFIPQIYELEYSYSYLYHNNGDWTFTNVSELVGVMVWNTYGGAWCDYNNDGFLDLITGGKGAADQNATYEIHMYRNNGNTNSWLQVKLMGNHYNKAGIGVRVKVTMVGFGASQVREVEGGMGCHSSQNSIPIEFGFGNYSGAVDVEVTWPSGFKQKIEDVSLNQLLKIEETKQAPDLQFINVKVLEDHPIAGETLTIQASVANMGYFDAERAVIRFYDGGPATNQGGTEIGESQVIYNLEKFHSAKVTTYWNTTGEGGTHNLWAVIEEVEPAELIITNNAMNSTVYIRAENKAPLAVLKVSPVSNLKPGDTIFFDGSNSSDDISIDFYNFNFEDGNESDWITNSQIYYQYTNPGTFTASLRVKDSDGRMNTNKAELKLSILSPPEPNRAPIIDRFNANPTELKTLETTNLKVIAHDPEDDELTYHLTASYGELSTKVHSTSATWRAPEDEGIYSISAVVFDGELYSDIVTINIKVIKEIKNHLPEIIDVIWEPTKVVVDSIVTFTVYVSDPDPNEVFYFSYTASGGSIFGTDATATWQTPAEPGAYIITVEVVDSGGLSVDEEFLIMVEELNFLPDILDVTLTPDTISNDKPSTVLVTVELFDENGLDDISSVTIDLEPIGVESDQRLYDTGKYGDFQSYDGIYSYEIFVPTGVSDGVKILTITVRDRSNSEVTEDIQLRIEKGGTEEDSKGFTPGFEIEMAITSLMCIVFYIILFRKRR